MFHVSNFGAYGISLSHYTDIQGYVPEAGDAPDDLEWDAAQEWDADSWDEFVSDAVRATSAAQKKLDAWRAESK